MFLHHLEYLRCPSCHSHSLIAESVSKNTNTKEIEITNGFCWCKNCLKWYPVENGVLDLLTGSLVYANELKTFWHNNREQMKRLGLKPPSIYKNSDNDYLQKIQQEHSDWFADNDIIDYTKFSDTPFWRSVDHIVYEYWLPSIPKNGLVLEPGCGQGRFTKYLYDRPLQILAFDLSKKLLSEAIETYQFLRDSGDRAKAEVSFIAADATAIPVIDASFDIALLSGVLHHLPSPETTCSEIARVLTSCGIYLGTENNNSVFRRIFDLLQYLFPLWKEEAGPEALISKETLSSWLNPHGMELQSFTHVYVPPHLVNMFSEKKARRLLCFSDSVGNSFPLFRSNGGLITFISKKTKAVSLQR